MNPIGVALAPRLHQPTPAALFFHDFLLLVPLDELVNEVGPSAVLIIGRQIVTKLLRKLKELIPGILGDGMRAHGEGEMETSGDEGEEREEKRESARNDEESALVITLTFLWFVSTKSHHWSQSGHS